jgi:hypothetical protein
VGTLEVQSNKWIQGARAVLSLLELFVSVDDFCQVFLPFWKRKLMEESIKNVSKQGN